MNGGRRFDRIVGEGLTDLCLNHKTLILFSYNSKSGQDYLQIFQDQGAFKGSTPNLSQLIET